MSDLITDDQAWEDFCLANLFEREPEEPLWATEDEYREHFRSDEYEESYPAEQE